MSSQLPGRQSPEPSTQTDAQQHDVPGSGKIGSTMGNARPAPEFAQQKSEQQKRHSLESNPENAYEKIEAAKYAK
jgi:hypothetical protein